MKELLQQMMMSSGMIALTAIAIISMCSSEFNGEFYKKALMFIFFSTLTTFWLSIFAMIWL